MPRNNSLNVVPPSTEREHRHVRLGSHIRRLREAMGISQRELARRAQIAEGYIPRVESGFSRPEPATLRRLANVLDVHYGELASLAGYIRLRDVDSTDPENEDLEWFQSLPPGLRRAVRSVGEAMIAAMVDVPDVRAVTGTDPT